MKQAKQRSGKQRKAGLLSYVKKSWVTMRMRCPFGVWRRICQPEVTRDAWRKMSLNQKALWRWPSSGWSGWHTRKEFTSAISWTTQKSASAVVNFPWMVFMRRRKLWIRSTDVIGTSLRTGSQQGWKKIRRASEWESERRDSASEASGTRGSL